MPRHLSPRSAAYSWDSAARRTARASRRTRCSAGSGIGTAAMRRCVYSCFGCAQDLPRGALLDDLPVVHHDDPVGERVDDGEVVADEQAREAEVRSAGGAAAPAPSPAPTRRAPMSARRRSAVSAGARGRGRCRRAASARPRVRAGSGCGTPGAARRHRADPARACRGRGPWPRPRAASARRWRRRSAVAGSARTTGPGRRCRRPCAPCAAGGGRPWRCRCRRPSRGRPRSAAGRSRRDRRWSCPSPDSPTRPVTSPGKIEKVACSTARNAGTRPRLG